MLKSFTYYAIPVLLITSPAFAQDNSANKSITTSLEAGASYSDSISIKDNGTALNLDNVKTLDFGARAEKELLHHDNVSLSGALSGQASFGDGGNLSIGDLSQTGDTNYRRLEGYADIIAQFEGSHENDWTPFLAAGAGVVEERVEFKSDNGQSQVFKDLSPAARFRAGVEKKVNDKVSFGVGAGPSVKLD